MYPLGTRSLIEKGHHTEVGFNISIESLAMPHLNKSCIHCKTDKTYQKAINQEISNFNRIDLFLYSKKIAYV